jgi:hypothetical protein
VRDDEEGALGGGFEGEAGYGLAAEIGVIDGVDHAVPERRKEGGINLY